LPIGTLPNRLAITRALGVVVAVNAVRDISGTAFWVARFRALESRHAQPLFVDPWAERLAGERGAQIVRQLGHAERAGWSVVIRTAILDRVILEAMTQGFDTVISLAAGLDARPFRLHLPAELRWVDIDKPEIIDYKRSILKDARSQCEVQWLAVDLSDASARRAVLSDVAAKAGKALVLSEGLLVYLDRAAVTALAQDLHRNAALHTWLFDMPSADGLAQAQRTWNRQLAIVNAPLRFGPAEGTDFFAPCGWREAEWISFLAEGTRLRRIPASYGFLHRVSRYFPAPQRARIDRLVGIARLERANTA
jgi:methyltransferase (TIGR00027 family)